MPKFGRQKFHSLGAAAVFDGDDDDEELDLDDVELEDSDGEEDEDQEEDEEDTEEDDSEDEDEEEPDVKSKSKRENDRLRRTIEKRKETERENIQLRQDLDKLRNTQNQQVSPQNDEAAYQAWLNTLPADQKVQAQINRSLQQHNQQMQVHRFQMADQADKAAFDAMSITNPIYKKYAAKVEQKLASLRNEQNITAPREEVLKHIIGETVLKIKGKATTKKDAKASISKNKIKPGSAKKTDLNGGARKGKSPRDRLQGVKF